MQITESNTESKMTTYLGFCIRAGKISLGLDRATALKRAELMLWDGTLSENSKEKAVKLQQKFGCKAIVCEGTELAVLLHRPGCKLAAVTDKNLAEAILCEAEKNGKFKLLRGDGVGGNI